MDVTSLKTAGGARRAEQIAEMPGAVELASPRMVPASEREDVARRVALSVTIGGHDATNFLEPYLLSFTYTDNATGKADSIRIELQDRDGTWTGTWAPDKGTGVSASLRCLNWFGPGQHAALNCGAFQVDEVEFSGVPDKLSLKAVTASLNSGLRETAKTKAWEGYTLRGVAAEVAAKHGLTLLYDAPGHSFARQDQREESDLAFLTRLATARGVNLKVHDGKLALYGAREADGRKGALTIPKTGSRFSPKSYSFKEKSQGTAFTGCEVNYRDPNTQQVYTWLYDAHGNLVKDAGRQDGGGRAAGAQRLPRQSQATVSAAQDVRPNDIRATAQKVWAVNQRVESEADARALAQNALRGKNGGECTGNIEIMGHPGLVAGVTLALTGFGTFSGSYFVNKAEHKIGNGYSTSAELRRTLAY